MDYERLQELVYYIENEGTTEHTNVLDDALDELISTIDALEVNPTERPKLSKPKRILYSSRLSEAERSIRPIDGPQTLFNELLRQIPLRPLKTAKKPLYKPITSKVMDMPHISQKRKQWAGKPRVKTNNFYDFNPKVAFGYIKRSVTIKLATPTKTDYKKIRRSALGQTGHTLVGDRNLFTPVETRKLNFEEGMLEAYINAGLGELQIQLNTQKRREAFNTYVASKAACIAYLRDIFRPTVSAFMGLEDAIKDFITDGWERYGEQAMEARSERLGMNLTDEEVEALPDADRTIIRDPKDPRLLDTQ